MSKTIIAEVKVLKAPEGQGFDFPYASSTSYLIFGIKLPFVDYEPCGSLTLEEAEKEATEKANARCATLAAIFNQILNQALGELQAQQAAK